MSTTKSLGLWLNAFLPPLAWGLVIFFLSSQQVLPGFETSVLDFILKKVGHMTVYAVLYILLFRAFRLTAKFRNPSLYWTVPLIICLVYAITDELHQALVPGRYPTIRDVGYDMLGVSVALLKTSNCI